MDSLAAKRASAPVTELMNAKDIIKAIHNSFPLKPVPATGLFASQADDAFHGEEIGEAQARQMAAQDRSRPWNEYSDDELEELDAAMAHQEAAGFIYFLPAYLCAALRQIESADGDADSGEFVGSTAFLVTSDSKYNQARLAQLSAEQRKAVTAFLKFIAAGPDKYEAELARKSLQRYWLRPGRT